jgi:hypothetical protein
MIDYSSGSKYLDLLRILVPPDLELTDFVPIWIFNPRISAANLSRVFGERNFRESNVSVYFE